MEIWLPPSQFDAGDTAPQGSLMWGYHTGSKLPTGQFLNCSNSISISFEEHIKHQEINSALTPFRQGGSSCLKREKDRSVTNIKKNKIN